MIAENGYHLLNVVISSIFHIATRDVLYYDHRGCVVSNAPHATQSPPSVSPPAPPRACHTMDQLIRWLIALLSFIEEKYYTLKKGNYMYTKKQTPEENTQKNTKKNSLRLEEPGKIIDTEKIIDTRDESVRTLNPAKIINTDKILDTREDGEDAVLTLNSGSEKIIDTGQDADLTL
jgi:hypothetical protein